MIVHPYETVLTLEQLLQLVDPTFFDLTVPKKTNVHSTHSLGRTGWLISVAVLTVALSWTTVNTVFTRRCADLTLDRGTRELFSTTRGGRERPSSATPPTSLELDGPGPVSPGPGGVQLRGGNLIPIVRLPRRTTAQLCCSARSS